MSTYEKTINNDYKNLADRISENILSFESWLADNRDYISDIRSGKPEEMKKYVSALTTYADYLLSICIHKNLGTSPLTDYCNITVEDLKSMHRDVRVNLGSSPYILEKPDLLRKVAVAFSPSKKKRLMENHKIIYSGILELKTLEKMVSESRN